jgi:PAS domain S-box-containing protein
MQFERVMILVTFLVFGIYISHLILKKRDVETDLIESEERFKRVSDFAKDWEYWITKERKLNYVSPSSERITGYRPEEFINDKSLLEKIVHNDDKQKFLEHTKNSLCSSDLDSFEFRIITKNNKTIWIEHSCQSVFNPRGKYLGHRASNRDITRRKIAEEAVINARNKLELLVKERTEELEKKNIERSNEINERKKVEQKISQKNEFLSTTINSLSHPFYVIDAEDYSIVLANSATEKFRAGVSSKCFAVTHRRESPCGLEYNCPLEIVKRTKKQTTVEHIHYDKQGKPRVFEVHGHPIFDSDGNVIQMIEYSIEITKRKRLEKKVIQRTREIKAIIEQSPSPIAIYSKSGEVREVNSEWRKLFLQNNTDGELKNLSEDELLISSGYMPQVKEIMLNGGRLKTEPILFEKENRMIVYDIYDIRSEKGLVRSIVCQIEDRTDELQYEDVNKELNLQKRISSAVLDILEEDRKRVSKELHDQIGQKLLLAKLGLELIEDDPLQSRIKIEQSKKQIIGISKDIKSIIFSLRPAELDNYGLVDAIQLMVRNFSDVTGIKAMINVFGNLNIRDKKLELNVYRIIQEALNNISKHAKAKDVQIDLHFNSRMIRGIVKDNGVGFDVKATDKGTILDIGYGLISMRERSKISGGEFSIQSEPGKGTEIYFAIPFKESKDE